MNKMLATAIVAVAWLSYGQTNTIQVPQGSGVLPTVGTLCALYSGEVDHPGRGLELVIHDLAWRNTDAYRSPWNHIARHGLLGRIRWNDAPLDDPTPELFIEPRLMNTVDHDRAWFRIADAPAALDGGHDVESTLAIGVADDVLTPWNNGDWLDASTDGGQVRPANVTPDVALNTKALASVAQLSNWGLPSGEPAAIARADDSTGRPPTIPSRPFLAQAAPDIHTSAPKPY